MKNLPKTWVEVPLARLVCTHYGKGLTAAQRNVGEIPVYGSAGVVGFHDEALTYGPVLIVGRKGNVGAIYLASGRCWPIDTTYFLSIPFGIDSKFLTYCLRASSLGSLDSSTAVPSLRRDDLERQLIPIPPENEQRRIVATIEEYFSRLDAADESLARISRRLRSLRTGLLATAFCDWPERCIGKIADVYVGTTPSRRAPELWGGEVPWVSSGEVAFSHIRHTRETISPHAVTSPKRVHPPGTVLLAMIGEGKTRGQAAILDVAAAHNQNSAAIRLDQCICTPEWLFYVLMGRYEETRRAGSGAQQPALNRGRVEALKIPLPPLDEQYRLVGELERQLSLVDTLDADIIRASGRSAALRRSILEQAFKGTLVPQDPSDEPASILLERIAAEHSAASPTPHARTSLPA